MGMGYASKIWVYIWVYRQGRPTKFFVWLRYVTVPNLVSLATMATA